MMYTFIKKMDFKKLMAICREKRLTPEEWRDISEYQHLTEDFMWEFADELDWDSISAYQHLTEDFMRKIADKLNWFNISEYQHLSENFMREFADELNWQAISEYQHLSEDLMRELADEVDWLGIPKYQHLSEDFMREFADKLDWDYVFKYQDLSEDFVSEFADRINFGYVNDSWRKKSVAEKKAEVEATGLYECYKDYFIAYKRIRDDRYSEYNFQYQYMPGHTYETFADYSDNEDSFGFFAWTYEGAKDYCDDVVVTCKVYYKDVARVVHDGGNIRCSKITILD